MKILVLNGPNLNMLGKRDQNHYGSLTLHEIKKNLSHQARGKNVELTFFQSNHEGALIDFIQENFEQADGILINPGALTHYSYALADALSDTKLPIIEVHLSDVQNREDFRKIDVLEPIVVGIVSGLKDKSYYKGFEKLVEYIGSS